VLVHENPTTWKKVPDCGSRPTPVGLTYGACFDRDRTVPDPKRLAKVFRALSNPNRLRIYLEILNKEEATLEAGCHLMDAVRSLKIGSPTISHHVKELVNADLITAEREGKFLVCRVNPRTRELARAMFGR